LPVIDVFIFGDDNLHPTATGSRSEMSEMPPKTKRRFDNPYDTIASAGLRFLMEVIAWVAMPWWAWEVSGPISAILTLIILMAIPGVFSTVGDKRKVVVPTPGAVRVLIELGLFIAAIVGAWSAWSPYSGIGVAVIAVLGLIAGRRRVAWLLKGASLETGT
jgi:hypothetical protein